MVQRVPAIFLTGKSFFEKLPLFPKPAKFIFWWRGTFAPFFYHWVFVISVENKCLFIQLYQ